MEAIRDDFSPTESPDQTTPYFFGFYERNSRRDFTCSLVNTILCTRIVCFTKAVDRNARSDAVELLRYVGAE